MRKLFFIPLVTATLLILTSLTADTQIQGISIQNRPLVRVHSETITVLDLQKRLDLSIAESNSKISNNLEEKYMYYLQNWAGMLNKMINDKLIAAEGNKLKIMISDCDVNEQMIERFGPSPLTILSPCNLNIEEGKAIVLEDLIVNGMTWHRVYSKTQQQLTPLFIRNKYDQYKQLIEDNKELSYQYITIRAQKPEEAQAFSDQVQSIITINQIESLDQLPGLLKEASITPIDTVSFSISEPVKTKKNDLSVSRSETLSSLTKLSISKPITHDSNTSGKTIRYYQLLDETSLAAASFEMMQTPLKNTLFENISNEEMVQYISRLKQEFFFDENQLEDLAKEQFIPFAAY